MSTASVANTSFRLGARQIDTVQAMLLVGLLTGVAIWAAVVPQVDVLAMNDLGLVSVLPPLMYAAFAIVIATFALTVSFRPHATLLLVAEVAALIVILFAITGLVESAARFSVSWRHAGIIEVMTRTGRIDPTIDAYFSWPGFFALGAFLTEAAGLSSAIDMAPWAPLAFNLMYLPAVLMIMRAGSADARIVWTGTAIFFVGNWIGQDYFSPQGFAYFLYLLVIGLVLTMFRARPQVVGRLAAWFQPSDEPDSPALRPIQRAALMTVILVLFGTTVYSHQLTPFAIVGVVLVLVLARRISTTGLPIVMLVLLGTWLSFMTVEYLSGHIASMISRIGNVDTTVAANLTDRFRGSAMHVLVLGVRSLTTVLIFGIAGLGALLRILSGRRDLTWGFLVVAPFGLLLLQDYGGEMLLRVYLFSLPFAAFLAAHALIGARSHDLGRRAVVLTLSLAVLLGAFLVSRYGNERMDMITTAEVQGATELYQLAPPDSLLVALSDNAVWKWRDYELYHYAIASKEAKDADVGAIVALMDRTPGRRGYLLVTRSQLAALELRFGLTSDEIDGLIARIDASPQLELVYSNDDTEIFTTVGGAGS